MAQPDATDPGGGDVMSPFAKLVTHPKLAQCRLLESQGDYRLLDLGSDPIPEVRLPAGSLHEGLESAFLHRLLIAIEGVAGIAHHLAGPGDVSELLGKAQQSDLVLDDFLFCTHGGLPFQEPSAPVVLVHNQGNPLFVLVKSVRSDRNYCNL